MPANKTNYQLRAGEPSPAQKKAIEHAYGPMQVLAGPGAGKTYLMIRRIRHLICHHGISPDKILVITFTKAAALEMQHRFIQLTNGNYPAVSFGTFHAVYYHILNGSGKGGKKYHPISGKEKVELLRHCLAVCGIRDVDGDTMEQLFKEISAGKNEGVCETARNQTLALPDDDIMNKFPAIFEEYCRMM